MDFMLLLKYHNHSIQNSKRDYYLQICLLSTKSDRFKNKQIVYIIKHNEYSNVQSQN